MTVKFSEYNNNIVNNLPPKAHESSDKGIVTMGQVIGMIGVVLASIIEAIEKSGKVGKNYLISNLEMMRESAGHSKKAQQDKAQGMSSAAIISIATAGLGIAATAGSTFKMGKNLQEMGKIQKAPLSQPPKSGPVANPEAPSESLVASRVKAGDKGGHVADIGRDQDVINGSGFKANLEPSKQKDLSSNEKVLHGKDKDATSYASEAEKERAFKMQQEAGQKPNVFSALSSTLNPHTLPLGNIEQARKEDDAAKSQYASETTRANSETMRTLQGENSGFYGSLTGSLEKIAAVIGVTTQALVAASSR